MNHLTLVVSKDYYRGFFRDKEYTVLAKDFDDAVFELKKINPCIQEAYKIIEITECDVSHVNKGN